MGGLRPKGQKRTHAIAFRLISFSEIKHPLRLGQGNRTYICLDPILLFRGHGPLLIWLNLCQEKNLSIPKKIGSMISIERLDRGGVCNNDG